MEVRTEEKKLDYKRNGMVIPLVAVFVFMMVTSFSVSEHLFDVPVSYTPNKCLSSLFPKKIEQIFANKCLHFLPGCDILS